MEFLDGNLAWVITTILTVLGLIFGTKWTNLKGKLLGTIRESSDVAITAAELLKTTSEALADDKLTPEEIAKIKEEALEFVKEFEDIKDIWKKDPAIPVQ